VGESTTRNAPRPTAATTAATASSPPGVLARAGAWLVSWLSSYGLAVCLLLYLMLLTFLGTIRQVDMGLFDVQQKYFEEIVFLERVGPLSVPMLGAAAVLVLLGLNLVVGGLVRIRKQRSTWFVVVIHVGMLFLFTSGLVEYLTSRKGRMLVYEGATGATYQSYYDWEIVVRERKPGGGATDHVFGAEELADLDRTDTARFTSPRLPFEVAVTSWTRNGRPARGGGRETEGWRIEPLAPEKDAEANLPGALVTLHPTSPGTPLLRTWLWGGPYAKQQGREAPWVVDAGGRTFEIDLRQQTWYLPFAVRLRDFVYRKHPGTEMAAEYSSYVTKIEGTSQRDVHITMNAPLRHAGHTLYQSGWGPQDPDLAPGTRMYSIFAVVENVADQWPKYACYVIGFGLLFHFVLKLYRFIAGGRARRAAATGVRP
jgi:hypothetical protein